MASNFREFRQQGSPHIPPQSPSFCYFPNQTRLSGYMGPELGRTQHQHFQGDHPWQSPHPPHPHPYPHPHHRPFPLAHSHDMHEVIQREIEKERIREEIIMSEIMRRRELEAEVRRELMMEREQALMRGSSGFPIGGSPLVMGFDRLPLVETMAEGRSLEERTMSSLTGRDRLNGRCDSGEFEPLPFRRSADVINSGGGFEPLPFQRGSADVRNSEVKPVSEGDKVKEKIILLAKPSENILGMKRETSGMDASESQPDGNSRKKAKEEWSCALCQVSATSERGLNEHLQGKKHKLKEAALKAAKDGKNYTIGLFPKKAAKDIQVPGTVVPGTESKAKSTSKSLSYNESGEASSKKDDRPPVQDNLNSDNSKKNEESVVDQKVQKNEKPKKNKFRFWCDLCQVGIPSQRMMNNHLRGKKHKRRLHEINQNEQNPAEERPERTPTKEAVDITKPEDKLTKADVANEPKDNEVLVS